MRTKIYQAQHHARDWQLNVHVQMALTDMLLLPLSLVEILMKKSAHSDEIQMKSAISDEIQMKFR